MPFDRILPDDARKLLEEGDGYVYLDVRTTEEFAAGHVPSAINVPLLERNPDGPGLVPNPNFVEDVCSKFARDDKIITGCLRGARSLKAAELLVANGFTGVTDMRGGWDGEVDHAGGIVCPGWARLGFPIERDG